MSGGIGDRLTEGFRELLGTDLRVVAEYGEDWYEIHFIREDIDEAYDASDREEIFKDVVLSEVGMSRVEELYERLGEIEGTVALLEHGSVAHFWPDDRPGVFVSFDRGSDPGVYALAEVAHGNGRP